MFSKMLHETSKWFISRDSQNVSVCIKCFYLAAFCK